MLSRHSLFALCVCIVVALLPAAPTSAQSDADLRRENQRLTTEVEELKRALEAAQERLEELEAQIQALRERRATDPADPDDPAFPEEEEKVSIDETESDASPRALLNALRDSYNDAFEDREYGDNPDAPERALYLRAVDRWFARAAREFREQIEWVVTINRFEFDPEWVNFEAQAVDPVFGTLLGEPFMARVDRSRGSHIVEQDGKGFYQLKGLILLEPTVAPIREMEGGHFNRPPFIGPFAEMVFAVQGQNIVPTDEPRGEEADDDADGDTDADDTGGEGGGMGIDDGK